MDLEFQAKGSDHVLKVLGRGVAGLHWLFRADMRNGSEGLWLGREEQVWKLL